MTTDQVIEHLRYCLGPDKRQTPEHWMESMRAAIDEIERLRGIKPAMPPMPPAGEGLPRYGLRWNGPTQPLAVPMDDGYWTPWHLADQVEKDHEEVHADHRRLVRELDVLLNGEEGAAQQASLVDIVAQLAAGSDLGPGDLEVGLSKDLREVVVNHPCLPLDPRGGHLVFSPQQARDFASLLMLKADQAEGGKA